MGLDRLSFLLVLVAVVSSCGGEASRVLFNGARPARSPPQLTSDVVVSRVEVMTAKDLPDSLSARCPGLSPHLRVVRRIGVAGGGLTFRDSREPAGVLACDAAPGEYELTPWCGVSAGRLEGGRLRDPRLDLCQSRDGRLTGFVWIEPLPSARWVGIDQGPFTEIYEVAGDLPVRIASTRGIQLEGSRATFEVSQYDTRGRVLEEAKLEAAVAG